MDAYQEYLPTKSYKIAVMKMRVILDNEIKRLQNIAEKFNRENAIAEDNLKEQIPFILKFTEEYHNAYNRYLETVIPQQPHPIACRPACGNCCHHYPKSVEPFETIYLYNALRKRENFFDLIEDFALRSKKFNSFYQENLNSNLNEDEAEDKALHEYFNWWKSCPFSDKKGDCSIYPLRPVSCRMYFCESDPQFCTPEFLQTEKNSSYIVYLPDEIEEAIYEISSHYSALEIDDSFFGALFAMNLYEGSWA